MALEDHKYAQRNRLEYLDRLFFWNGAATRASLIQRFAISNAQAALDFRAYISEAGDDALLYDASSRQYLASDSFSRLTGCSSPSEIEELLSNREVSSYDALPDLQRTQNVRVFQPLYRALLSNKAVEIVYQSMRQPEPETRWIAPVRFASDGVRLHVRAWCYKRKEFRDFIPARIDPELSLLNTRKAEGVPIDDDWNTWATLRLRPHSRLTEDQQRVVRIEFGFKDGELEVRIRKALEFYTERRWGLEQKEPRLECVSIEYTPMTEEEINADRYEAR